MAASIDIGGINARVRAQYEKFPYPNYPLWLPLRAQEAYASHSLFAARVLEQQGAVPCVGRSESEPQGPAGPPGAGPGGEPGGKRVLIAGCGDIFPYMATFWEPRAHRLTAVDLSARSLRRARLRCLPRLRDIAWLHGNLEDPDLVLPQGCAHIDCYGVLHHLEDPARALRRLGGLLAEGGTARIMVYNSEARSWIRHVQRAFALLGLSAFRREDLRLGQAVLRRLEEISPALRQRFAPMDGAFANPSRFVDTFLHQREARLGLGFWFDAIAAAGLRMAGVFDRYAELDDLPNPLLEVPAREAWQERIADRRFENNLELYLAKAGSTGKHDRLQARASARGEGPTGTTGPTHMRNGEAPSSALPSLQVAKPPPKLWFEYAETRSISWSLRRKLWEHFLRGLCRRSEAIDAWASSIPPQALQRLARLGAVFPDDFRSAELRALLHRPIHAFMEPPEFPEAAALREDAGLRELIDAALRGGSDRGENRPDKKSSDKNRSGRIRDAVLNRLDAAQRP